MLTHLDRYGAPFRIVLDTTGSPHNTMTLRPRLLIQKLHPLWRSPVASHMG